MRSLQAIHRAGRAEGEKKLKPRPPVREEGIAAIPFGMARSSVALTLTTSTLSAAIYLLLRAPVGGEDQ
jgi:hypothetical protein